MSTDEHPLERRHIDAIAQRLDIELNGEAAGGDSRAVSFVLIAWEREDDVAHAAMISNSHYPHEIIAAMLDAIAQYQRQPPATEH